MKKILVYAKNQIEELDKDILKLLRLMTILTLIIIAAGCAVLIFPGLSQSPVEALYTADQLFETSLRCIVIGFMSSMIADIALYGKHRNQ